jgi:Domain of Unknown Function (DUF1080)
MGRSALLAAFVLLPAAAQATDWRPLFNGKNLDGWEVRGESVWTVMREGALLGSRPFHGGKEPFGAWPISERQFGAWLNQQSWLYTKEEFKDFDLHLEYWMPPGGNSGVSIRDTSRGRQSFGAGPIKTPAHIGYEIQIIDGDDQKFPTGSIYLFAAGKTGLQRAGDWNEMEIESREKIIRVRVNGQVAAEHPGDPARAPSGPIGLQLHDRFSWIMFRNIKIRVLN